MSSSRSTRSSASSSTDEDLAQDQPGVLLAKSPPSRDGGVLVVKSPSKDGGSGRSLNPRVVMEKVDKVQVAIKHPGGFMETSELEKETGHRLRVSPKKEEKWIVQGTASSKKQEEEDKKEESLDEADRFRRSLDRLAVCAWKTVQCPIGAREQLLQAFK